MNTDTIWALVFQPVCGSFGALLRFQQMGQTDISFLNQKREKKKKKPWGYIAILGSSASSHPKSWINQPQGSLFPFTLHPFALKKKSPARKSSNILIFACLYISQTFPFVHMQAEFETGSTWSWAPKLFAYLFFTCVGLKTPTGATDSSDCMLCSRENYQFWAKSSVLVQHEGKFQCAGSGNKCCKISSIKQTFQTIKPRVYGRLSLEIFKSEKSDNVKVIVFTGLSPVTLLICFRSLGTFLHTKA